MRQLVCSMFPVAHSSRSCCMHPRHTSDHHDVPRAVSSYVALFEHCVGRVASLVLHRGGRSTTPPAGTRGVRLVGARGKHSRAIPNPHLLYAAGVRLHFIPAAPAACTRDTRPTTTMCLVLCRRMLRFEVGGRHLHPVLCSGFRVGTRPSGYGGATLCASRLRWRTSSCALCGETGCLPGRV